MSKFTFTTHAACKIATMDRLRFNQHVHAGHYPCAPETIAGRTRAFDVDDIIALFFFARLLDSGQRPEFAGRTACLIRRAIHEDATAEKVAVGVILASNPIQTIIPPGSDVGKVLPAGFTLLSATEYNIASVRVLVTESCDQISKNVGTIIGFPDDE